MFFTTVALCLLTLSATGWAGYVLEDDYFSGGDFFGQFTFFDEADPTGGFVQYSNDPSLYTSSANNAMIWASNETSTPNGRPSIRITSNKAYDNGLVILDLAHMPGGICGTWPAFWMVGPNWPAGGEIDIIEGVNDQTTNDMTLHTSASCSIHKTSAFSGTVSHTSCFSSQNDDQGCGITTANTACYGSEFNSNNGGVYATEITSSAVSIFFFPRDSIPSDITSGSPDPTGWGMPVAKFTGTCDLATDFTNMQLVFDTTFCGRWAGEVWSGSTCASSTGYSTCQEYVANEGAAFDDAYWSVNALQVYSSNGAAVGTSSAAPSYAATSSTQASATGYSATTSSTPTTLSTRPHHHTTSIYPADNGTSSGSPTATGLAISSAPGPASSTSASAVSSSAPPSTSAEAFPTATTAPTWMHTWTGGNPWHTGWPGEGPGGNGGYDANDAAKAKERRARHMGHHRRAHGPGRR